MHVERVHEATEGEASMTDSKVLRSLGVLRSASSSAQFHRQLLSTTRNISGNLQTRGQGRMAQG